MVSLSQVLVGEEALLKKLKSYEKENEVLKKKLAQVMMHFSRMVRLLSTYRTLPVMVWYCEVC